MTGGFDSLQPLRLSSLAARAKIPWKPRQAHAVRVSRRSLLERFEKTGGRSLSSPNGHRKMIGSCFIRFDYQGEIPAKKGSPKMRFFGAGISGPPKKSENGNKLPVRAS
jgi:hypothetical protein